MPTYIDRKDFTVEERVAIGEEIERLIGERRGRPSADGKMVQNFAQLSEGEKSRDFVAQKAGFKALGAAHS